MKVIIAGSRTIRDLALIETAVRESGFTITEVVSGRQRSWDSITRTYYGADYLGEKWAEANGIPVRLFPADWAGLGRSAGMIRNRQMAAYGEALIAVWEAGSRGTANMISEAMKRGLKVYVLKC